MRHQASENAFANLLLQVITIHIDSLFPFLLVGVSNQFAQNTFHIQYTPHAVS